MSDKENNPVKPALKITLSEDPTNREFEDFIGKGSRTLRKAGVPEVTIQRWVTEALTSNSREDFMHAVARYFKYETLPFHHA